MASNLRWISLAALGAGCFALALGCSEDASSPDSDTAESGGTSNCADADCGSGGATGGGLATGGSGGTGGGSAGAAGSGNEVPEPLVPLTIYLAGDSTVATYADTPSPNDQAGWGQMLHEHCTGGNGTGAHAQAMRNLAAEEGVLLSDLNAKTVQHLQAICPAPTPEDFFFLRQNGTVDGTHFQENGARIMAGFVADGVEPLQRYRMNAMP